MDLVLLHQLLPVTTSEQISVQSHDISWVRPLWLPDSQMLLLFTVTHPRILVELHFYCPHFRQSLNLATTSGRPKHVGHELHFHYALSCAKSKYNKK